MSLPCGGESRRIGNYTGLMETKITKSELYNEKAKSTKEENINNNKMNKILTYFLMGVNQDEI